MNAHCADARTEEYLSGIAALVVIPVLCENIFPASAFSPADLSLSLSAESSVYGLLTSWASAPAQQPGKTIASPGKLMRLHENSQAYYKNQNCSNTQYPERNLDHIDKNHRGALRSILAFVCLGIIIKGVHRGLV